MTDGVDLLAIYDRQLRGEAENVGAVTRQVVGPVTVVGFASGDAFVSHQATPPALARLAAAVPEVLAHVRDATAAAEVEWKTRAHDHAPGLLEALTEAGFVPGAQESIVMGEARLVAVEEGSLPPGVTLRRIRSESDVRAMCAMHEVAFGEPLPAGFADDLLHQQQVDPGMELWVAEAVGQIISSGRLEPVADSEVAGIWGGATLPQWRGRGIYRALTAARARSALAAGKRYLHSDSTEFSRPILERSGMVTISHTTPYVWTRP